MRPRFEVSQGAIRMRTSGSPESNGATHLAFSKLYSMPDLEETTPGSRVYDHWSGGSAFSYWWEFLSAWGIIPGTNPKSLTLRIGGINYPVIIYEYDEDTSLSGSIGNSTNDSHGVVVICHGKLTLSNVTTAARKRGLFIWGDEVVGSANMTQKGAHAAGQNIPLYPAITVPAAAGLGGTATANKPVGTYSVTAGPTAGAAPSLGCGGGHSGKAAAYMTGAVCDGDSGGAIVASAGAGGRGTSYCGGAGGGDITAYNPVAGSTYSPSGEAGSANGTLGGRSCTCTSGYATEWGSDRGGNTGGGLLVVTGKSVSGSYASTGGSGTGYGTSGGGCVVALANEIGSVSKSVGNGGHLIQEV